MPLKIDINVMVVEDNLQGQGTIKIGFKDELHFPFFSWENC